MRKPIQYVSESNSCQGLNDPQLNCAVSGQEFPHYLSRVVEDPSLGLEGSWHETRRSAGGPMGGPEVCESVQPLAANYTKCL